jgi:hypothetical protein
MPTNAEEQDETQAAGAEDTGLPARLQASLDDLSVGQLRRVQRYAEAKVREGTVQRLGGLCRLRQCRVWTGHRFK